MRILDQGPKIRQRIISSKILVKSKFDDDSFTGQSQLSEEACG